MTTTTITELPYLARRVLRIVAEHSSICHHLLSKAAALDADMREQTDLLLQMRLITRQSPRHNFVVTDAGRECVKADAVAGPQKAEPRTFVRIGCYSGAELGYRGRQAAP